MTKRKVVSGKRSCGLWIIIGLAAVVVLIFGVLLLLWGPLIQGQLDAPQHYSACTAFVNSGDCDQAVVECEAVVRLDAFLFYSDADSWLKQARDCQKETHYQRGLDFMSLKEWQKALDEFQQVLDVDTNYKEVQARYQEVKDQMALVGITPVPPTPPPGATPTETPTTTPTPTETPTRAPTDIPPPTNTPPLTHTPTPTPPPTPIPVAGLTIIFQEDFSDPQSGWGREGGYGSYTGYKNGELVVSHTWSNHTTAARPHLSFDNFVLEVDSRWSGGAVGGIWGVRFRYQNRYDYYACFIGNDGRYEIGKQANGDWSVLLDGFADAIERRGGVNRFHLEANGHSLRFFVNDHLLGSVHDVEHDLGDIALVASNPSGSDFFEASFDNVIIAKHP